MADASQFSRAFGNCFNTDGKTDGEEKNNLKGKKVATETHDTKQERRKHKRFRVNNTVFAMLDSHPFGHAAAVLDVSKGGVGLQYCNRDDFDCNCWKSLDVISSYDNFCLRKLPIEIISDQAIEKEQGNAPDEGIKRCGVKFNNLTFTQQALLDIFIKENSNCKE